MKASRMFVMVIGLTIFSLLFISTTSFAAEEKWPTRPITIYIGYAPGGRDGHDGTDTFEEMRKNARRRNAGRQYDRSEFSDRNGSCL